jgi:hypothetical protein
VFQGSSLIWRRRDRFDELEHFRPSHELMQLGSRGQSSGWKPAIIDRPNRMNVQRPDRALRQAKDGPIK